MKTLSENSVFKSLSQVYAQLADDELSVDQAKVLTKALSEKNRYRYGLAGLAELLGCSKPTAHKIKESGKIPFVRIGKKFVFDEEKVMAALAVTRKELTNG